MSSEESDALEELRKFIEAEKMSKPAPRGWNNKVDRTYDQGWNDASDNILAKLKQEQEETK